MLLVSSTLFLPFPADQGYGNTRSTLPHRTVIQTALSAMLNQSTLGRTFTLLYRPRADAQPFRKWKMEIGNALRPYSRECKYIKVDGRHSRGPRGKTESLARCLSPPRACPSPAGGLVAVVALRVRRAAARLLRAAARLLPLLIHRVLSSGRPPLLCGGRKLQRSGVRCLFWTVSPVGRGAGAKRARPCEARRGAPAASAGWRREWRESANVPPTRCRPWRTTGRTRDFRAREERSGSGEGCWQGTALAPCSDQPPHHGPR